VGIPRFVVDVGGNRTDSLPVEGSTTPDVLPRFVFDPVPGTYRLVYDVYRTDPDGSFHLVPKSYRISNAFDIVD
jgi:hypothetical protein